MDGLAEKLVVERPPLSPTVKMIRDASRSTGARVGLALTVFVLGIAVVGPLVAPHGAGTFVGLPFAPRSSSAPLGTDYLGRDVLSRVLLGGESLLWMTFAATTLGVALGASLGLLAGYSRAFADEGIMRTLDVVYAFPILILILLFTSILGSNLWVVVLLVALGWTPQVARVIRGATKAVATHEFVQAAEILGMPRTRILRKEIVPMIMTPLLVEYGLRLTWSIGIIAAISFLGFGVQPPRTDWGLMINENLGGMSVAPLGVAAPIVCISLFAIGTNLITEAIGRAIAGIDKAIATE